MAKKKAVKKTVRKTGRKTALKLDYIAADLRLLAVEIAGLNLDPDNARQHAEADIKAVALSLERFGQRTPIVVNRQGNVIEKGNGTLLAAQQLGWTHIAAVWVEDDPSTHRGYALADNRTAELSAWDEERLLAQLEKVDDSDLFDLLQFDAIQNAEEKNDRDSKEVEVPESWVVAIECKNEAHQKELFERMKKEGLTCRLLTL